MIEKTFYVALAANWLMQNPLWQRVTASRSIRNQEYKNPYEYPKGYEPDSFINPRETDKEFMLRVSLAKAYDLLNPRDKETNWFHRKPFTCLYCITFWLALLCCVVVPMLGLGAVEPGVCFTAPVVALAFSRWYNSLPVKF